MQHKTCHFLTYHVFSWYIKNVRYSFELSFLKWMTTFYKNEMTVSAPLFTCELSSSAIQCLIQWQPKLMHIFDQHGWQFLAASPKCKNAANSPIYFSRCHKLWDYLLIQFEDLTFPIQTLQGMQMGLCPSQIKHICCLARFFSQCLGPALQRVIFLLIPSNPLQFFFFFNTVKDHSHSTAVGKWSQISDLCPDSSCSPQCPLFHYANWEHKPSSGGEAPLQVLPQHTSAQLQALALSEPMLPHKQKNSCLAGFHIRV